MTKKTKNKLIKGGAVFCALFCFMMSIMSVCISAKDNSLSNYAFISGFTNSEKQIDESGFYRGDTFPATNLYDDDIIDWGDDYIDNSVKLTVNISKSDNILLKFYQIGEEIEINSSGLKKTYYGKYNEVVSEFLCDLNATESEEKKFNWENDYSGIEYSQPFYICGLSENDYYYCDIVFGESQGSFILEMFSGFGNTIDGLGDGIKSMFNNILWTDGTAESGLSHFAKFGFVMSGLAMACGLGYVIIKKIRG